MEHQSQKDETRQKSRELPTISIIVPNYQGDATLAKTLQSLIDQNYPKLEIIVVDGGSTDNSVEIIKQFEPHLTWWVSEKDSGQSNAINKGFSKCTGDIVNWLCSDDLLMPNALHIVGKYFSELPDIDVLVGGCITVYDSGESRALTRSGIIKKINDMVDVYTVKFLEEDNHSFIRIVTLKQIELMPVRNPIPQSSCFYRRSLLNRPQPIQEDYHYAMDFELWNYFSSQGAKWYCTDEILSKSIQNDQTKSSTGGFKASLESERIYKTYTQEKIPLTFWHRYLRYPLECFIKNHPSPIWLYIIAPFWLLITLILSPFYGFERVWLMNWRRCAE
jgi:glycosyltransferase involved in cell wall biosynthesis